MRIIGCDLHARQQTLAMLESTTGEVVEVTLRHEGDNVREFYSSLPGPVRVGIEATGSIAGLVHSAHAALTHACRGLHSLFLDVGH
jgi:hypothetical protein